MQRGSSWQTLAVVALSGLFVVSLVSEASALGRCKARISKKDGTITVNARDVDGTLLWGWSPGATVGTFDNFQECVSGTSARKCTFAPEGELERSTAPPLCTLYLKDDSATCSDFISGCAVAARPVCPPDMEQFGAWCIDRVAQGPLDFNNSVAACHAKGRSLCPVEALVECDILAVGGTPGSCSDLTDGDTGSALWTPSPHAGDGDNVFGNMSTYGDDNLVSLENTTDDSPHRSFCCQSLGGF